MGYAARAKKQRNVWRNAYGVAPLDIWTNWSTVMPIMRWLLAVQRR